MAAPTVSCVCYSRLTILTLRNMCRPHKCWIKDEKMSLKRYLSINHCHMNKDTNSTMDESTEIPLDKLKVTYSRSSGPGGQHVNKVNTKAEVRFHLETADWISGDVKSKILLKYRSRINKAGELLVTSELSRSQQRNLRDCIQKISEMIAEASQKPPEPSEDDIALRGQRLERRNQNRLNQKKIQSATKRARRVDFD